MSSFNIKRAYFRVLLVAASFLLIIFSSDKAKAWTDCVQANHLPFVYRDKCPAACGETAGGLYCNTKTVTRKVCKIVTGYTKDCVTVYSKYKRCINFGAWEYCYWVPYSYERCTWKPTRKEVCDYKPYICYSCWYDCCLYCRPGDCGTKPPCNASSWSDTSSCSVSCGGGTKTQVNDCGSTRTVACNTQSCSADVEGYIWDATDKDCNASKSGNEITDSDVDSDVTPTIAGQDGTWDSGFSGKNYEITGVTPGNNKALSANIDAAGDIFEYTLKCLNNSTSGVVGNSAIIDVNSDTTAHLGYELTSSGWFQALGGSIFAGGSNIESVSVGLPGSALTDFTNYLIDGPGSLFTSTLFSVKDTNDENRVVDNSSNSLDDNKYYYEDLGEDTTFWPSYFSFSPSSDAGSINDVNGLIAGEYYDLGSDPDALSGNYTVSGDGVAVVYVEGTLTFDGNFRSSNDNRILFVVDGSVEFSSDIGEAAPTASTDPHVQAGIIAKGSIDFESTGAEDDTTIIVESPLVAKDGSIVFGRNRGIDNSYPGTVVKFNPIYILDASDSSVSLINIIWSLDN